MEPDLIINQLEQNKVTFQELLRHVPDQAITWKPKPDKWCLLEVICHLRDEEVEDFRIRTQYVLEDPTKSLPKIDPVAWVTERNYVNQDFQAVLIEFLKRRTESIQWLRSLKNPSWENAYQHPKMGPLTAQFFLTNWLAHDYLHFRQITRLKYEYLDQKSAESLDYAGGW